MLKKRGRDFSAEELPDIAASYQEAIIDALAEKTIKAAENNGINRVVVCGGVAANSRLREKFAVETSARKIDLFIPPIILCTDNAAMIAAIGEIMLKNGCRDALNMNAVSRWPLA
jgi:N6-L-threonylcarbamoyladenine synthase